MKTIQEFKNRATTFPALLKEAQEYGVVEFPEADSFLFRYIMSLQPRVRS